MMKSGMKGADIQEAGLCQGKILAEIQQRCFPEDSWSADFIETLLGQSGNFGLLAVTADDEPIGFALLRVVVEDAEILSIGVLPAARGSGIGQQLLEKACAGAGRRGATALFLEVAEDNKNARNLYAQSGFITVGRRPDYYVRTQGRVAALVLRRSIP